MIMYPSLEVQERVRIRRIYSFFEHDYENGYKFSGEMHNFWECVCVTKGQICAIADENVYDISAGEIIVHKPLEFHGFFVNSAVGAHVRIFTFSMEGDLDDEIRDKVFRLSDFQKHLLDHMYDYVAGEYERVRPPLVCPGVFWYAKYIDLFHEKPLCLQMAASFIVQLLLSLPQTEARPHLSRATDAGIFHRAVDYMSAHVDHSLSVEDVAKRVSVSASALNRIFQKYAQVAVHKYYLLLKIKSATQLLQSGIGVSETARRLGFSNQSYFSACYKRETGTNPSEVVKK